MVHSPFNGSQTCAESIRFSPSFQEIQAINRPFRRDPLPYSKIAREGTEITEAEKGEEGILGDEEMLFLDR